MTNTANFPPPPPGRLETLDALRGLAAFYVFLHHYGQFYLVRLIPSLGSILIFGQAAVLGFFMISGFSIHYTSFGSNPQEKFKPYFIRRVRRIYPIYLISIALGFVCALIQAGGLPAVSWRDLTLSLLMLQGIHEGSWAYPAFGNLPTWSLSFEWYYYLAYFPLAYLFRKHAPFQKYAVAAIALTGIGLHKFYPNPFSLFAIYFPLWWCGAELAAEYLQKKRITLRGQLAPLGLLLLVAACWMLAYAPQLLRAQPDLLAHPFVEARQLLTGALLFLLVIILCPLAPALSLQKLRRLAPLGSISYGVYVFHLPILYLMPSNAPHIIAPFIFLIAPAVILLAFLCEHLLQPAINRLFPARA